MKETTHVRPFCHILKNTTRTNKSCLSACVLAKDWCQIFILHLSHMFCKWGSLQLKEPANDILIKRKLIYIMTTCLIFKRQGLQINNSFQRDNYIESYKQNNINIRTELMNCMNSMFIPSARLYCFWYNNRYF